LVSPPKHFKVAFVGDSAKGDGFKKVLSLIKREKADLVLHLGDLSYDEGNPSGPKLWDDLITTELGEAFPYFFVIGNHDVRRWYQEDPPGYATYFKRRLAHNPEVQCVGENGIKSFCVFRGLFFVFSGAGTYGNDHESFLSSALQKGKEHPWKICMWHKNQREMQVGNNSDEVGWEAYQICQEHGAMIATGHDHSYARSRTLKNIGKSTVNHGAVGDPNFIELKKGQTFAFVSGLGGDSLYPFNCKLQKAKQWWSSVFTSNFQMSNGVVLHNECTDQGASKKNINPSAFNCTYGALFITFHIENNPLLAKGEFKTIHNDLIDEFTIQTEL
jgi:predicted phosphodiesterase